MIKKKMNPIGDIIPRATCLIAKVLMINKMTRTGLKFPGCLRSPSSRVSQCTAGVPAAWGQARTHCPEMHGDWGKYGSLKRKWFFYAPKIGKSRNVCVFCSCSIH